ncbi:MAG TPA: hypothetical protein PKY51_11525 [Fimbriimonadaceae bacterium]|nr:hypothetical protein [Fimbriimonadaceae bacterium]
MTAPPSGDADRALHGRDTERGKRLASDLDRRFAIGFALSQLFNREKREGEPSFDVRRRHKGHEPKPSQYSWDNGPGRVLHQSSVSQTVVSKARAVQLYKLDITQSQCRKRVGTFTHCCKQTHAISAPKQFNHHRDSRWRGLHQSHHSGTDHHEKVGLSPVNP